MPPTTPAVTARFATAALYLGSAVALAMLVVSDEARSNRFGLSQHPARPIIFVMTAALFVLSSILILLRPRRGYAAALFSGLGAVSCLAWGEFSNFSWGNAWIALNLRGEPPRIIQAALWPPILTAALTSISVFLSALRLLPERWAVRGLSMRRRTWPAFALSGLILAVWFGCSVMPYRIAGNVHGGAYPRLRILHVEKHGLHVRETVGTVFRDGKFGIWRVDRRLFSYRFTGHGGMGVMPESLRLRAFNLAESAPNLAPTPPPSVLWAWRAEGWYVVGSGLLLSYRSEGRSVAPQEVIDVFNGITGLAVRGEDQQTEQRDICLGLCYGPVAALGFVYPNHHCTAENGVVKCP